MAKPTLSISIGGTNAQSSLVFLDTPALSRVSPRWQWARDPAIEVHGLLRGVVEQSLDLMRAVGIGWAELGSISIAWPGPGRDGMFEATFIPGCEMRQPVANMLRSLLAERHGVDCAIPTVNVYLDALARSAGETWNGGGLRGADRGLLINIATGIAGGLVLDGQVVLAHSELGEYYGQFGRYLILDTSTERWSWRPTTDGSVPSLGKTEVRWTRLSAGPALAPRVARWLQEHGHALPPTPKPGLELFGDARNARTERALLELITKAALSKPSGPAGVFADAVASEWAGAICCLLEGLRLDGAVRIVLAGGVGENLFLPLFGERDLWLNCLSAKIGRKDVQLSRSTLGVNAEITGLAVLAQPPGKRCETHDQ